jgi:hypothetical protein
MAGNWGQAPALPADTRGDLQRCCAIASTRRRACARALRVRRYGEAIQWGRSSARTDVTARPKSVLDHTGMRDIVQRVPDHGAMHHAAAPSPFIRAPGLRPARRMGSAVRRARTSCFGPQTVRCTGVLSAAFRLMLRAVGGASPVVSFNRAQVLATTPCASMAWLLHRCPARSMKASAYRILMGARIERPAGTTASRASAAHPGNRDVPGGYSGRFFFALRLFRCERGP